MARGRRRPRAGARGGRTRFASLTIATRRAAGIRPLLAPSPWPRNERRAHARSSRPPEPCGHPRQPRAAGRTVARVDRFWLLTWTTYGSWLPGDRRGSTSSIRASDGRRRRFNTPTLPPAPPQPGLERVARNRMTAPPVRLSQPHAQVLLRQFRETAGIRGWDLFACAIMANHVHAVVGVSGDPDPTRILRDFKSYGSRALNDRWGAGGTRRWWTKSGSCRRLSGQPHVVAAIDYVRRQRRPLVVWSVDTSEW